MAASGKYPDKTLKKGPRSTNHRRYVLMLTYRLSAFSHIWSIFSNKIAPQNIILEQNRTTDHHFRTKSHHRTSFWNKIAPQNIICWSTIPDLGTKAHHRKTFFHDLIAKPRCTTSYFDTKSHRTDVSSTMHGNSSYCVYI